MSTYLMNERHMLLTTYRKSGEGVATPVWTVQASDGRVGMWTAAGTGKEKRLRRDPHVTVRACAARGKPKRGSPTVTGLAEIVRSGPLFDEVRAKIAAKYGRMIPIVRRVSRLMGRLKAEQNFGDTVVLITLADPGGNDDDALRLRAE